MNKLLNITTLIIINFLLSCGVQWQDDVSEELGIFKLEKRRQFSYFTTIDNTLEKETYLYLNVTFTKIFNDSPRNGVYELYLFTNEYFAKIKVSGKVVLENDQLVLTPTNISPENCKSTLMNKFTIEYSYGSTTLEMNFNSNLIVLIKPSGTNLTAAESWDSICIEYIIE